MDHDEVERHKAAIQEISVEIGWRHNEIQRLKQMKAEAQTLKEQERIQDRVSAEHGKINKLDSQVNQLLFAFGQQTHTYDKLYPR